MADSIPNVPGKNWIGPRPSTASWPEVTESPEFELLRNQTSANPGAFFDFAEAVQLPALLALAPNTQRAYASDWRSFVRFCKEAHLCPAPTTPAALEAFIEFSAEYSAKVHYRYVLPEAPRRDVKASTIQRALRAIGAVHEWLGYPNPAAQPDVRRTFRAHTDGRAARHSKAPLSYSAIERALSTYGTQLPELRAKALVTVAFSTMLRRSELVALQVDDFQPIPGQDDGCVALSHLNLNNEPADQVTRYVSAAARAHLEAWLAAAGLVRGPIFVRFNRNGEPLARSLHANEVARIFKDVARRAGFAAAEVRHIAAHSTRIGATQALGESGASLLDLMADGGWKSPHMPARYLRELAIRRGGMAQWSRTAAAATLEPNGGTNSLTVYSRKTPG